MAQRTPARPPAGGQAGQGQQQGGQARRYPVEQVIGTRRPFAGPLPVAPVIALPAPARVAPHRIGRVGQAVEGRARQAGHGKPEQRRQHGVAEVLGQGFDGAFAHLACVESCRVPADQPGQALAACGQGLLQCGFHGQHLVAQHAPGQKRLEQHAQHQGAQPPGHGRQQPLDERVDGEEQQRQQAPGDGAQRKAWPVAHMFFAGGKSSPNRSQQPAHGDHGVYPHGRLAPEPVDQQGHGNGQRGGQGVACPGFGLDLGLRLRQRLPAPPQRAERGAQQLPGRAVAHACGCGPAARWPQKSS